MVGDVFADVGDGSVGADDDLGVFVGEIWVSSLVGDDCFGAGAAHDVAAFVFAGGLEVEDAFFEHESTGCVPEVESEDFAFAGEEVVLDVETLHRLEMAAEDGGGDEVGDLCGVVVADFESVESVEADLFAGFEVVWIGGVPLGDAGVEVPAVEVDALVGLEELGEEFASAREGFAFEVDEADDDVRDLDAGVVDVILHAYFVTALEVVGAEKALEGVAEDGVAEVADVGGLVGIDAGVLDEAEAGAADVGVLVGGDSADGDGAVETNVEVASACYLDAGDTFEFRQSSGEFGGEFGCYGPGGFAEALGEFEGNGEGEFAEGDTGGLLDDEVR